MPGQAVVAHPLMPRARHDEVIVTHVDGEILIADLGYQRLHWLSGIAALVWGLCDGTTSVAAARARLLEHGAQNGARNGAVAPAALQDLGGAAAADDVLQLAVLRFHHRTLLHAMPLGTAHTNEPADEPAEVPAASPNRRALARRIRAAGLGRLDPVIRSATLGAAIHAESFGPYRHVEEPCGVAQPPCSPGLRCHTLGQPIGVCT